MLPTFALALVSALTYAPAAMRPATMARSALTMVDQFRWSTAKAGGKVTLTEAPSDIKWAKAAWESLGKDATDTVTSECCACVHRTCTNLVLCL